VTIAAETDHVVAEHLGRARVAHLDDREQPPPTRAISPRRAVEAVQQSTELELRAAMLGARPRPMHELTVDQLDLVAPRARLIVVGEGRRWSRRRG
jgi:hypothetical protein